jgi:hypothetical protein
MPPLRPPAPLRNISGNPSRAKPLDVQIQQKLGERPFQRDHVSVGERRHLQEHLLASDQRSVSGRFSFRLHA